MLPKRPCKLIVDAGCGAGRQTLALAKRLQTLVHAVDSYEPFLSILVQRAKKAGVEHHIQIHCMDMADIPGKFQVIDLLWSEGAAYNIGFAHALKTWHSSIRSGGLAVVSELSWLRDDVPAEVLQFFQTGYPGMQSADDNCTVPQDAGYNVLFTYTLPRQAWVDGYYDILEPRAKELADHPDNSVRDFAAETLEETRIFDCSEDSYGYVFYVMQRV